MNSNESFIAENVLLSKTGVRCKICLLNEEESEMKLVSDVCNCKGASGNVHLECLETWMTSSNRDNCEVCLEKIHTEKIPKYGILRSIPIFLYSSKISQIVIFIMVLGILVYVSSVRHFEKLTIQSNSYVRKLFLFAVNMCIFLSVFVISYSPLLCFYLWNTWREWRKTQYTLRVRTLTHV